MNYETFMLQLLFCPRLPGELTMILTLIMATLGVNRALD